MNDNVVKVGEIVMITGGQRAGCRAKVLAKLNGHAIKAKVTTEGYFKDEILNNVRFNQYEKIV